MQVRKMDLQDVLSTHININLIAQRHPNRAAMKLFQAGGQLHWTQVRQLTECIKRGADPKIRVLLLGYYGRRYENRLKDVHNYCNIIAWFIDHCPESFLLNAIYVPEEPHFSRLRLRWFKQIRQKPGNLAILNNAALFCSRLSDTDSERFWKKARNFDPSPEWSFQLAKLYMFRINEGPTDAIRANAEKAVAAWETALAEIKSGSNTLLSATMQDETTIQIAELSIKCGMAKATKRLARTLIWKDRQDYDGMEEMALYFHAHTLLAKAFLLERKTDRAVHYVEMLIDKSNNKIYSDFDTVLVNGLISGGALASAILYVEHYLNCYTQLSKFDDSLCQCNIAPKTIPSRLSTLTRWLNLAKQAASRKREFKRPIKIR